MHDSPILFNNNNVQVHQGTYGSFIIHITNKESIAISTQNIYSSNMNDANMHHHVVLAISLLKE